MIAAIEMTDTFGGEANYSWVHREQFAVRDNMSRLAIVRKAKAMLGITGQRCRTWDAGDMIQLDPYGRCVRVFITFEDG